MVDPSATVAAVAALDQVRAERDELRSEVAEAHQLIALIRQYDDAQPAAALVTVGVPEPVMLGSFEASSSTTEIAPKKTGRPRKPEGDVA